MRRLSLTASKSRSSSVALGATAPRCTTGGPAFPPTDSRLCVVASTEQRIPPPRVSASTHGGVSASGARPKPADSRQAERLRGIAKRAGRPIGLGAAKAEDDRPPWKVSRIRSREAFFALVVKASPPKCGCCWDGACETHSWSEPGVHATSPPRAGSRARLSIVRRYLPSATSALY